MKHSLFLTGFIQVFFVAVNTVFLAKSLYIGVFIAAFMISIVWSFNVKKVVFSSLKDRFIYSLGAACGSCFGLLISTPLTTLF